ncbi:MAG TPA: hypothetical protein VMU45_10985 [Candidatus Eisenbacteria bacterium]|nr:hypothetical protein [Candidatus Eisenbacteria bacterium]
MHKLAPLIFLLWLLPVLAFCLATPTGAQAGNIVPWMTGTFPAYDAFLMLGIYSDGDSTSTSYFPGAVWFYWLEGNPTIPDLDWWQECDESGHYCERHGQGFITAGAADGMLSHWDGTDFVPASAFTGSVTGGEVH